MIRPATETDLDELARLRLEAFPGPMPLAERRDRLRPNARRGWAETLVDADERTGALRGCLTILPYEIWIGGRPVPMAGIGGVAVSTYHRRQGVARRLLTEALTQIERSGTALSGLYPFNHRFYEGYGYAVVSEVLRYRVSPALFPDHRELRGHVRRFVADDLPGLLRAYDGWCRRTNGAVSRSVGEWRDHLTGWLREENHHLAVCAAPGQPISGVLAYRLLPGRLLEVREWVAADDAADRAFESFLAGLGEQIRDVVVHAAPHERRHLRLLDRPTWPNADGSPAEQNVFGLHTPTALLGLGMMLRTVDLERTLVARRYAPLDLAVTIRLTDPVLSQPPARTLTLSGGEPSVGEADPGVPAICGGIGPFTQLWAGYLSLSRAVALGLLTTDADAETIRRLDWAFMLDPLITPEAF